MSFISDFQELEGRVSIPNFGQIFATFVFEQFLIFGKTDVPLKDINVLNKIFENPKPLCPIGKFEKS